jgi:hypothetical protein
LFLHIFIKHGATGGTVAEEVVVVVVVVVVVKEVVVEVVVVDVNVFVLKIPFSQNGPSK